MGQQAASSTGALCNRPRARLASAALRAEAVVVCLEASGNYSLDVAWSGAPGSGVKLQVANPRECGGLPNRWGSAARRIRWTRVCFASMRSGCRWWSGSPSAAALRLRALSRPLRPWSACDAPRTGTCPGRQRCVPACLVRELEAQVRYTEKRLPSCGATRAADRQRTQLGPPLAASASVPGLGESSALAVLAELAVLPDTLDRAAVGGARRPGPQAS